MLAVLWYMQCPVQFVTEVNIKVLQIVDMFQCETSVALISLSLVYCTL